MSISPPGLESRILCYRGYMLSNYFSKENEKQTNKQQQKKQDYKSSLWLGKKMRIRYYRNEIISC